jgi:hypothetical protein
VFFLPGWALVLPIGRQILAWALFVFVSVFALTNSLRTASTLRATTRADQQTEGIQAADRARETVRARRDEASGRGLGKNSRCQITRQRLPSWRPSPSRPPRRWFRRREPESSNFASSWHG